jgi:hypothetical protein
VSANNYFGNGVVMGRSLAAIANAADTIYCQELDWSNNSAQLRPFCSRPGRCALSAGQLAVAFHG